MTPEKPNENFEKSPKEQFLQDFMAYRNNYIDDLPPKKVMPETPHDTSHTRYKCRGNFFAGVSALIDRSIRKKIIINPEAIKKGEDFISYVRNRDFSKSSSQEDINYVNEILDCMIKELS